VARVRSRLRRLRGQTGGRHATDRAGLETQGQARRAPGPGGHAARADRMAAPPGGAIRKRHMTTNTTPVEIWTDGACKGNPGPGGWGALLRMGPHEKTLYGGEPDTTNNRMELFAVIAALRALTRPCAVIIH